MMMGLEYRPRLFSWFDSLVKWLLQHLHRLIVDSLLKINSGPQYIAFSC
jgi:hypothetical protein